jgi:hypothetical protein
METKKAMTFYHLTDYYGRKCREPGCNGKYDYIELDANKAIVQCIGLHSLEFALEFNVDKQIKALINEKNIKYLVEHLIYG